MGRNESTTLLASKSDWQCIPLKHFCTFCRCAGKYTVRRWSPWFFWFFWTYTWKTAIGFVSPSNCHCQAIRLYYGCAYAILINMLVVLPFLCDHVTAHRSDTLCELTAEEIFNMADFFFNKTHSNRNVITLFWSNCKNRMCNSALQLVVCINSSWLRKKNRRLETTQAYASKRFYLW